MLTKKIDKVTRETAAQLACALTKKLSIRTINKAGKAKQIKNLSFEPIFIFLFKHETKPISKIGPIIII